MTINRAFEVLQDKMECTSGVIEEAWGTVKRAVDKQIPQNLVIEDIPATCVLKDFHCPTCHSKIISFCDGDFYAGKKQHFCDNCGQALDWGESNGKSD